nr:G-type lectin S-receptor-like serine/threonine-protein kinase At2g19130 [Ipomoea batatas]
MDMFFRWAALLVLFQATCIGARSATLSLGQSLSPGQSLISPGGKFELGFFHPGNSSNDIYVGIWYANISVQTVVWVLNRDNPILNSSGNATLMLSGANLQLFNDARELIWFTNVSSTVSNTTEAMLLDTGNFVVKNDVFTYWESFDYPTDTLLPGMKFGFDETSGKNITLSSWRDEDQPGTGLFSLQMDPNGNGEFVMKDSSETVWRSGPWDGEGFQFIPRRLGYNAFNFSFDGKYVLYNVGNDSITSRIVMTPLGIMKLLVWSESTKYWDVFFTIPSDQCQMSGACGDYGICNISSNPVCKCLPGFEPKSNTNWDLRDFSDGCERKRPLHCNSNEGGEDGFLKISNVKWPASSQPLELGSTEICRIVCLQNCSCNAYAYSSNGRCLFWNKQLLDLEQLVTTGGDLFLKYPKNDTSVLPPTGARVLPPTG